MDYLSSYAIHAALVAFPEHRADDIAELHHPANSDMVIVTFDNGDTFYYFCS